MKKIQSKVIFAGAVQNAEKYLPAVFQNIENLTKIFSHAGYVFIENDSTDNTKQILKNWGSGKSNYHIIHLDGLNTVPFRTVRLEMVRNAYLEVIRYHADLRDFDYLVVIDTDEAGIYPINSLELNAAIEFLSNSHTRAGCFANQRGTYYDMWALRLVPQCPSDAWEEVLNYVIQNKCTDEVAFAETFRKRIFSIDEFLAPIKVDSAFGGFGIYKMRYVLNNPNPYLGSKTKILPLQEGGLCVAKWQICEHVHFHAGINGLGGEMYIYPSLINGVNFGMSFPPSTFRGMLF